MEDSEHPPLDIDVSFQREARSSTELPAILLGNYPRIFRHPSRSINLRGQLSLIALPLVAEARWCWSQDQHAGWRGFGWLWPGDQWEIKKPDVVSWRVVDIASNFTQDASSHSLQCLSFGMQQLQQHSYVLGLMSANRYFFWLPVNLRAF